MRRKVLGQHYSYLTQVLENGKDESGRLSRRVICKVALDSGSYPRPGAVHRRVYSLLLADDFTLLRDGVAAICRTSMKYCIVGECADGLAAASLIASLKPDIAILKLNLPELHGTEVIRRTRQAGIETRFLALAEHRDSRAGKDALRAGADGCLLTYDSADCLLEALQRILNGNVFVSPNLGVRACCPQDPLASLSVREHQVFSLLVSGLRPKQIANHLDLSLKTVDTYRANLMKKLEIYNLPGLVKLAIQRNLTSLA